MTDMTPGDFLIESAEYIAEHGHCKKSYEQPDGRVCAVGSMNRVYQENGLSLSQNGNLWSVAYKALREHVHKYIPYWNDSDETTAEDVILTMKTVGHQLNEEGVV